MTLRELLGAGNDTEITGLAYDHRRVGPGTLFFCVPGFTRDGHDFAAEAVAAGAAGLVVDHPLELGVPEVVVADVRSAMAAAAARLHGDPTRRLSMVGITGTNGKTTTAYLVRALLEAAGRRCGLLGTVTSIVGGEARAVERTTPEAIDLQALFAAMVASGDRACVMEVSSHALELRRADAIHFDVAVFTNLSRDHLDFHSDMESYFAAKSRLFTGELAPGIAVVNVDDPFGARLAARVDRVVTFAASAEADWRVTDMRTTAAGSDFVLWTPRGEAAVSLPLPGRFNVLNAVAALAAVHALGVELDEGVRALASAPRVPGRFERVDAGQPFAVLVDYAHTPDGLENVLAAAREIADGRVLAVFGAGGDRDRGKRALMGAIAARMADLAIVTSDNPRSEDPESILDDVLAGAPADAALEREVDRRTAIARAVELARAGDVVVVAGKGHEQGQEFARGRIEPFDDATVVREVLEAR